MRIRVLALALALGGVTCGVMQASAGKSTTYPATQHKAKKAKKYKPYKASSKHAKVKPPKNKPAKHRG